VRYGKKVPKKGSVKTGKYADELSDEETCFKIYMLGKKVA